MVAYTQDYCLPYFEGSDSLCVDTGRVCAPSTVWCDMAQIVDDAFTSFDDTISRAVDSFPYVQVAVSDVPFTFSSGVPNIGTALVVWDTVVGDSDGMATLAADPTTVTLRRSGIWNLHCTVVWRNDISDTDMRIRLISPAAPKIPIVYANLTYRTWVEPVPSPGPIPGPVLGLSEVMDLFYLVDVSTGPAPLQIELEVAAGVGDHDPIIEVCRFSARWVADLP